MGEIEVLVLFVIHCMWLIVLSILCIMTSIENDNYKEYLNAVKYIKNRNLLKDKALIKSFLNEKVKSNVLNNNQTVSEILTLLDNGLDNGLEKQVVEVKEILERYNSTQLLLNKLSDLRKKESD